MPERPAPIEQGFLVNGSLPHAAIESIIGMSIGDRQEFRATVAATYDPKKLPPEQARRLGILLDILDKPELNPTIVTHRLGAASNVDYIYANGLVADQRGHMY